ncbi:hypothetical protein [Paenibacillus lutrae]|uniref:Uncharacterized protein n=1 Tax=Paenibacillus lutrae TaxID=2078573 RepID=A0A7X3JZR6_9BACL|nr:hypothetical protein [Paenibacillus lutrae]MVP00325.1 hypothetical protein [Paenibacillus lutrae]
MKESKPDWYSSLEEEPFRTRKFSRRMADEIKTAAASPDTKARRFGKFPWKGAGLGFAGLILAAAFLTNDWKTAVDPAEQPAAFESKSASLTYVPLESMPLEKTSLPTGMEKIKSIPLGQNLGKAGSPVVTLYADIKNKELLHAYLSDGKSDYHIGLVSNQGLTALEVKTSHWTGEDNAEIQIDSPIGPGMVIQVVRYNPLNSAWELQNFEQHQSEEIDLDGDGQKELVENHLDWVPPAVHLNRWNADTKQFERAAVDNDAAEMMGLNQENTVTHSYLFQEKDKWLIEFGAGDNFHVFMEYHNGKLQTVDLPDKRSRLADLRNAPK